MSSRPGLVTPLTHLNTSYMFVLCIDSHAGYHTINNLRGRQLANCIYLKGPLVTLFMFKYIRKCALLMLSTSIAIY